MAAEYNGSKYADHRMPWVGKNPGTQGFFSLTDAAAVEIVPWNAGRVWLCIQNLDAANPVYLALGGTAVVPAAGAESIIRLAAGQSIIFDRFMPWPYRITAIMGAGLTADVTVNDVIQVIADNPGRGSPVKNPPITEYGE